MVHEIKHGLDLPAAVFVMKWFVGGSNQIQIVTKMLYKNFIMIDD